jgi:hypothetical protein
MEVVCVLDSESLVLQFFALIGILLHILAKHLHVITQISFSLCVCSY